jgi:hypothetical protein
MQERIDKLVFIKIKSFYLVKDNVKSTTRQDTDVEEIFPIDLGDTVLLSKPYRGL